MSGKHSGDPALRYDYCMIAVRMRVGDLFFKIKGGKIVYGAIGVGLD